MLFSPGIVMCRGTFRPETADTFPPNSFQNSGGERVSSPRDYTEPLFWGD